MSEAGMWHEHGGVRLRPGDWVHFDDVFRVAVLVRPAEMRASWATVAAMLDSASAEQGDESGWEVAAPERRIALYATGTAPALMLCGPASWVSDEPAAAVLDSIVVYAEPVLQYVERVVETSSTRADAPIPTPSDSLGPALSSVHAEMVRTAAVTDRRLSGRARVLLADREIVLATRP